MLAGFLSYLTIEDHSMGWPGLSLKDFFFCSCAAGDDDLIGLICAMLRPGPRQFKTTACLKYIAGSFFFPDEY